MVGGQDVPFHDVTHVGVAGITQVVGLADADAFEADLWPVQLGRELGSRFRDRCLDRAERLLAEGERAASKIAVPVGHGPHVAVDPLRSRYPDADEWHRAAARKLDRLVPRAAFHMTGDASLTQDVVDFVKQSEKPTVFTIDYEGGDDELTARGTALRAELCRAGIPAYPSLRRAAWALARLPDYHVHRSTSS